MFYFVQEISAMASRMSEALENCRERGYIPAYAVLGFDKGYKMYALPSPLETLMEKGYEHVIRTSMEGLMEGIENIASNGLQVRRNWTMMITADDEAYMLFEDEKDAVFIRLSM